MVSYTYRELVQMYSVESTSSSHFLRIFPRRRAWGICVNRLCGSPADRYELYGNQWIVEVNRKETPDLQTFVNVTKELEHEKNCPFEDNRVGWIYLSFYLKQDLHFWPTWELIFDPKNATWRGKTLTYLAHAM